MSASTASVRAARTRRPGDTPAPGVGARVARARPALRAPALLATTLTLALVGGGLAAGALAAGDLRVPGQEGVRAGIAGADGLGEVLLGVLAANLPVAASLAAGIVTAGLLTAVAGLFLGLYLGVTVTAAVNTVGPAVLFASVVAYVALEMLGLALAAIAGFLPVSAALAGRRVPGTGAVGRYVAAVPAAAGLLAVACVLLLVGAVIEASVIASPGG